MAAVWVAMMVAGFTVAFFASRRAVHYGSMLASGGRIPPFVIGITLFAVGTDLPEIANSIVASIADHGDINVGDSIGSTATQATLVLGLLPLLVGAFTIGRARFAVLGAMTVAALLIGAALLADGFLSRVDAAVLVAGWVGGSYLAFRHLPPEAEPVLEVASTRRLYNAAAALVALAAVGGGAALAVLAFIELAELLSVPEYLISFFVASIGTSLPELVVDVTALRRGARDLAVGDVIGSSFVDSTLSIGIGPFIAPTAITASLAVRGSLVTAGAIAAVVVLFWFRRRHDRRSGAALLGIYGLVYVLLLA